MEDRHHAVYLLVLLVLSATSPLMSKDGKLALRVTPNQAYVFIDEIAIRSGGGSFKLSPGGHTLDLRNYGYKTLSQKFTIAPGKTIRLALALEAEPGEISGPWGRLQFKGPRRSVVLLNGMTLDHFVGYVGEFDSGKRDLLLPPGRHEILVLHPGDNKEIYSSLVAVNANEQVTINLNRKGEVMRTSWARGEQLKSLPRFSAQHRTVTVAVSRVTGNLSAAPVEINCGESTELVWTTEGASQSEISGIGGVPTSGNQSVRPNSTTTYDLSASGLGGVATVSFTVRVNKAITASMNVSPQEVHYKRLGDKVEQESANLTWSTANAEQVSINGEGSVVTSRIGTVNATGTRVVQTIPERTDAGPVDESRAFTLKATNTCGASEARTATLHIVGSIVAEKSPVEAALETTLSTNSVYFPTALPSEHDLNGGLVSSQQRLITELAGDFKKYVEFRHDAHLILQGHADERGSAEYNQALSERRAIRVKVFLLEQGIPAAKIEAVAYGKERNLDKEAVRLLEEKDPNLSEDKRRGVLRDLGRVALASNRRVDIFLSTIAPQPTKPLPYAAEDAGEILGGEPKLNRPAKPHRHR
jgi:outer membrane protein OmpA-like peptidoglycan-associated protein